MDGTEYDALRAETMRLHFVALQLVELLAEAVARRHLFGAVMAQAIRDKAALQLANDRLREELRRYTRAMVSDLPAEDFDTTEVPPPRPAVDKHTRARQVMRRRASADGIFLE